ncbi:hypothetical protein WA026_000491 [Henosepilachna vigintioctopunctata]|uniref:Uncharacterized protein n=1 Tax=Henosepilachna vigintioctopunctata TaxID=420089 RepID=A0AAW1V8I1_9CUCU
MGRQFLQHLAQHVHIHSAVIGQIPNRRRKWKRLDSVSISRNSSRRSGICFARFPTHVSFKIRQHTIPARKENDTKFNKRELITSS